MIILPKTLHAVAVVTVTRPVTQTAEVAVNRQSRNETDEAESAWEKGSFNKTVPINMIVKK